MDEQHLVTVTVIYGCFMGKAVILTIAAYAGLAVAAIGLLLH